MFKNITHILLLTVFLVTSMGFTITRHYCGDKLIVVSLKHVNDCCTNCNRCHSKICHIKIKDSFVSEGSNFSFVNPLIFSFFLNQSCNFISEIIAPNNLFFSDISPPPIKFDKFFLEVFRN